MDNMIDTSRHDDRIGRIPVLLASSHQQASLKIRDLMTSGHQVQPDGRCDNHPTCNCYSQCHALVW